MTREEEIREGNIPFYTDAEYNAFEQGAKWADEHPKSPWISVKDRLPEIGQPVLVCNISDCTLCTFEYGVWKFYSVEGEEWGKVTDEYWCPIPELPKGGNV